MIVLLLPTLTFFFCLCVSVGFYLTFSLCKLHSADFFQFCHKHWFLFQPTSFHMFCCTFLYFQVILFSKFLSWHFDAFYDLPLYFTISHLCIFLIFTPNFPTLHFFYIYTKIPITAFLLYLHQISYNCISFIFAPNFLSLHFFYICTKFPITAFLLYLHQISYHCISFIFAPNFLSLHFFYIYTKFPITAFLLYLHQISYHCISFIFAPNFPSLHFFYIYTKYSHQRISTEAGGLRNERTSGDHPNYSIVEIRLITEKCPGDLRRFTVAQTPVKNHELTLLWKTLKWVNSIRLDTTGWAKLSTWNCARNFNLIILTNDGEWHA